MPPVVVLVDHDAIFCWLIINDCDTKVICVDRPALLDVLSSCFWPQTENRMPTFYQYWLSMTDEDFQKFWKAATTTLAVGSCVLILFFLWLDKKFGRPAPPQIPPKIRLNDAPTAKPDVIEAAPPEPAVKRVIPRGAAVTLIQRADRLLSEGKFDEALVCYLSPLYVAVENKDDRALPANLTDCLRGAATCYRSLGQPEVAVKFLQAERCVFEEMLAQASNPTHERTPNSSILQALFSPADDPNSVPRRCSVLSEVAEACMKAGRADIALVYRVKATALKQKISGKPLDPNSAEFGELAETLAAYKAATEKPSPQAGATEAPPAVADVHILEEAESLLHAEAPPPASAASGSEVRMRKPRPRARQDD